MSDKVILSRRNLQTLLSKLDRQANGETTTCTLMVPADRGSGYVEVVAVEDAVKYANRFPGTVHWRDRR